MFMLSGNACSHGAQRGSSAGRLSQAPSERLFILACAWLRVRVVALAGSVFVVLSHEPSPAALLLQATCCLK